MNPRPTLRILGSRGIPAAHGGFETFAERLALHLAARGWRVVVYCQEDGTGPLRRDLWRGVERVLIPVRGQGAAATVVFDWLSIRDAVRSPEPCLTLGYNTALFCLRLRAAGVHNVINMDGIEWRRSKWNLAVKAWFWLNDWAGCWLADHLVADHPDIAAHLRTRTSATRISTILYGADPVHTAALEPVLALGLQPGNYLTVIARPEPENSVLEAVRTFSRRPRGAQLVVVGDVSGRDAYSVAVRTAAGPEVVFAGAVYDGERLAALRWHARAHVHGHQVGGTNPSLVEALAAGNAVLALDNGFNRWVAGPAARYFADEAQLEALLQWTLESPAALAPLRAAASARFAEAFSWDAILAAYEALLQPPAAPATSRLAAPLLGHQEEPGV